MRGRVWDMSEGLLVQWQTRWANGEPGTTQRLAQLDNLVDNP